MTIPTFVEFGADIKKIDETARSRFLWEWMEVEIIIEVEAHYFVSSFVLQQKSESKIVLQILILIPLP